MRGTTRPGGGADASPPARDDTPAASFRTTLFQAGLGHVQALLAGAILTPAHRTVTAALRVVGLAQRPQRYHRVLNRGRWSSLAASRVFLCLLVAAFVPDGPLVVGVDETRERRTGTTIAAMGVPSG